MVVTEALARASRCWRPTSAGVRSALGGTGLLVPPNEVPALAMALARWLDLPDLRAELRAGARARRGELTGWEVTSRCLISVLEKAGTPV
jgi:glycosyltransferase involved in cell wall biosynthesis